MVWIISTDLHFKSNEYFTAIIYNLNLIMVRLLFWKCGAICWRDRAIEALLVELFYEGQFFFFTWENFKNFLGKQILYMFSRRYNVRRKLFCKYICSKSIFYNMVRIKIRYQKIFQPIVYEEHIKQPPNRFIFCSDDRRVERKK